MLFKITIMSVCASARGLVTGVEHGVDGREYRHLCALLYVYYTCVNIT